MKLTLKKILALGAGALAIIAFIMAFVSPLKMVAGSTTVAAEAKDIYFEKGGTIIPFFGYVLVLIAGIVLIARQFVDFKASFKLAIAFLVVGVVLIFLTKTLYITSSISEN